MKRLVLTAFILCLILSAWTMTIPRVYQQKVTLHNGKLPYLTCDTKISAKEYIVTAKILEYPDEVVSTETHHANTICFRYIGNGIKMPKTAVISVNLGNFKNRWEAGQTLHMELTHKATKKKIAWDIYITEGTNVINYMKQPLKLPKQIKK